MLEDSQKMSDGGEAINIATSVANLQARLDGLNEQLEELKSLAEEDPITQEDINASIQKLRHFRNK